MGRRLLALSTAALLILTACGGEGTIGSEPDSSNTTDAAATDLVTASDLVTTTQPAGAGLPEGCVVPPFTATAQRVGSAPIGSDAFGVTDAVAVPIPVVPNPDGALSADETTSLAGTTDLLGYSLVFADEPIVGAGGMFFEYEPVTAGKLRGLVSIFPATGVPFVAGDVVSYGVVPGLSIPLPTIGLDLAAFDQSTNSYLGDPVGQVTVLGITHDAMCLDVDLTWALNDPADNTLTIRGVFAARLLDRSTLVMMS